NGVFTVALDFGDAAFDGQPRWLQITVAPASLGAAAARAPAPQGGNAGTPLRRQPVLPAPQSTYAHRAQVAVMAQMTDIATRCQEGGTAQSADTATMAMRADMAAVAQEAQSMDWSGLRRVPERVMELQDPHFVRVPGAADEAAYLGGDGLHGAVQLGSFNSLL